MSELDGFLLQFVYLQALAFQAQTLSEIDMSQSVLNFEILLEKGNLTVDVVLKLLVICVLNINGVSRYQFPKTPGLWLIYDLLNSKTSLILFFRYLTFLFQYCTKNLSIPEANQEFLSPLSIIVDIFSFDPQYLSLLSTEQHLYDSFLVAFINFLNSINEIVLNSSCEKTTLPEEMELRGLYPFSELYRKLPFVKFSKDSISPSILQYNRLSKILKVALEFNKSSPHTIFYDSLNKIWSYTSQLETNKQQRQALKDMKLNSESLKKRVPESPISLVSQDKPTFNPHPKIKEELNLESNLNNNSNNSLLTTWNHESTMTNSNYQDNFYLWLSQSFSYFSSSNPFINTSLHLSYDQTQMMHFSSRSTFPSSSSNLRIKTRNPFIEK